MKLKEMRLAVAAAAVLGSAFGLAVPASAAPLTLDLTSGTFSDERAPTQSPDTYKEDGFTLQADPAGNHMDPGFVGNIGFHNGPVNPTTDNNLILTFGGSAFQLLGIEISALLSGASLDLTGSNGASVSFTTGGFHATPGFTNVTSVTFSLSPVTGAEVAGLNALFVDNAATAVPEPSTLALVGLAALVAAGRTRRRVSAP